MLIAHSPVLTTHRCNSACRRLTEALGGTNSSPFGQQMHNSATQGIYPWTLISSLSLCHAKPNREGIHFLTAGCHHTQPHCCCPPLIAGPSTANLWQSPRGAKSMCLHCSSEIRPLWKDFFFFFQGNFAAFIWMWGLAFGSSVLILVISDIHPFDLWV